MTQTSKHARPAHPCPIHRGEPSPAAAPRALGARGGSAEDLGVSEALSKGCGLPRARATRVQTSGSTGDGSTHRSASGPRSPWTVGGSSRVLHLRGGGGPDRIWNAKSAKRATFNRWRRTENERYSSRPWCKTMGGPTGPTKKRAPDLTVGYIGHGEGWNSGGGNC